jgi:hypothetical protein
MAHSTLNRPITDTRVVPLPQFRRHVWSCQVDCKSCTFHTMSGLNLSPSHMHYPHDRIIMRHHTSKNTTIPKFSSTHNLSRNSSSIVPTFCLTSIKLPPSDMLIPMRTFAFEVHYTIGALLLPSSPMDGGAR